MTTSSNPSSRRSRGFTLTEVLVSLALVIVMILAASQVFQMSSDVAVANQSISAIIREHRGAFATLGQDFKNCDPKSPIFLIDCSVAIGGNGSYRDQADRDQDPNPYVTDMQGQSLPLYLPMTNDRFPRLDRIGFVARGSYRQQAMYGTVPPLTGYEAFVWYGHGHLLDNPNSTSYLAPEDQWGQDRILARQTMLLKDPVNGYSYWPYNKTPTTLAPLNGSNLAKLNGSQYVSENKTRQIDLAGATLDRFRMSCVRARYNIAFDAPVPPNPVTMNPDWYWPLDRFDSGPAGVGRNAYRFFCVSKISRPVDAYALAHTTTTFIQGCTQFVVEYAGDYLNQNPANGNAIGCAEYRNGNTIVPGTGTDGLVDFDVDPQTGAHRIRWYGLTRDSNGDGRWTPGVDVFPLATYIQRIAGVPATATATFESIVGQAVTANNYNANNASNYRYVCAFHNDAPKMIRILIKIDDPTRKLQDGQWFEYVFVR